MSASAGLLLNVGAASAPARGVLDVGWRDDVDVPFAPGEDFPFDDSSVDAMTLGAFAEALPLAQRVHLLLECRRVLRPGGSLRICVPERPRTMRGARYDGAADLALESLAALTGLEVATRGMPGDQPPSAWAGARGHEALDYTKPDRGVYGTPRVSILIPAYNPRFFGACLDSALAQTHPDVEIVVCDDSAGREIEAMVAARTHGRHAIRYERNGQRLRPRGNFVRCFERSRGEFVKFLCDDDWLAPECVERLVDAFRRAPDITLATSHRVRIDEHGRRLHDQPATLPIVAMSRVIAGPTLANAMLLAGLNTIGEPSTTLFRRSDFSEAAAGYFHFRNRPGHGVIDMVMWSSLLLKGNAVYLRESLSSFRIHPGQRQHDPVTRERSIGSIRALQAAWLELGIHERHAPDMLLTRGFPSALEDDWQLTPVQGFSVRRCAP